jgi:hypothetical protein
MDDVSMDLLRQETDLSEIVSASSSDISDQVVLPVITNTIYVEGPIGPIGPVGPTGPTGSANEKNITLTTTHHQIEQEDYLLIRSPIPRVITLPAPITGREVVIKALASAGAHRVIAPAGGLINEQQPMYLVNSYTSARFLAYEGVWYTV